MAILVAFVLWEIYAPLQEPLVPMKLFKDAGWVAACVLLGLGAAVYYAMAIIWPQMVAALFTVSTEPAPISAALTIFVQDDGGASMFAGWINTIPGVSIVVGQVLAGALAVWVGKAKIQVMVVLSFGGAFLAGKCVLYPI